MLEVAATMYSMFYGFSHHVPYDFTFSWARYSMRIHFTLTFADRIVTARMKEIVC